MIWISPPEDGISPLGANQIISKFQLELGNQFIQALLVFASIISLSLKASLHGAYSYGLTAWNLLLKAFTLSSTSSSSS